MRHLHLPGFSLVEAVVVVAILGLLTTFGFNHFQSRARYVDDQQASTLITSAIDATTAHQLTFRTLPDLETLAERAPGPTYTDAAAAAPGEVSYLVSGSSAGFATLSESGDCLLYRLELGDNLSRSARFNLVEQPDRECSAGEALDDLEGLESWR